jgi:hypothetical protein
LQFAKHEAGPAIAIAPEQALRRSVLACMLWENEFYEEGVQIAGRIRELIPRVAATKVAALAVEAREAMKLRHVPLLPVREMARHATHRLVAQTLARVIQRAHELSEFMVDISGSMDAPLARRSEMLRMDAACGLAVLLREVCDAVEVYSFSDKLVRVPSRRGFASQTP